MAEDPPLKLISVRRAKAKERERERERERESETKRELLPQTGQKNNDTRYFGCLHILYFVKI